MRAKIEKYIREWETKCYYNGIPDEVELRLEQLNKVPNYKQICMAILKNDFQLEILGFTKKHSLIYSEFKRIELENKGKIKKTNQLKLDL
jgi:predicted phosphoadenosine phosphosulfate sulfurtransferase